MSLQSVSRIERNKKKNPTRVKSVAESADNYTSQVSTQPTNMANKYYNTPKHPHSHFLSS